MTMLASAVLEEVCAGLALDTVIHRPGGGADNGRHAHQAEVTPTWNDMPPGVVEGVLACLSSSCPDDRSHSASVRLVCKEWREAQDMRVTYLAPYAPHVCAGTEQQMWQMFPRLSSLDLRACAPGCDGTLLHGGIASLLACMPFSCRITRLWLPENAGNEVVHYVSRMAELIHLSLSNTQVTDQGICQLDTLRKLEELDLSGTLISNIGIRWTAEHLPGITQLQAADLPHLSLPGICQLPRLQQLQVLDVSGCENFCDRCLSAISTCSRLKSINVAGCWQLSDTGIRVLRDFSELESLQMENCWDISDTGLKSLESLKHLHSLELSTWHNLGHSGVDSISGIPTLRIRECLSASDRDIQLLAGLTGLSSLNLDGCEVVSDTGLACIGQLTGLTSLVLRGCVNALSSIQALKRLTRLTSLKLQGCRQATDQALGALVCRLPLLRSIILSGWELLSDNGVASLVACKRLQHIGVAQCPNLTDSSLRHLRHLCCLEGLDISHSAHMTGAEIARAASSLRVLTARFARLTDSSLRLLSCCLSLTSLDIAGCHSITDSGMACLATLTRLESLELRGCKQLTPAALEATTAALPRLRRLNTSATTPQALATSLPLWSAGDVEFAEQR